MLWNSDWHCDSELDSNLASYLLSVFSSRRPPVARRLRSHRVRAVELHGIEALDRDAAAGPKTSREFREPPRGMGSPGLADARVPSVASQYARQA
jgi:hypothetical protein